LSARLLGERGQALVELVACLPVVALVVLAIAQGTFVLGAGSTAQAAVERARVAAALGDDPVAAARRGLTTRATVTVDRHVIRVSVPVPRVLAEIALAPARATASLVS
jgi:TadE-like protein